MELDCHPILAISLWLGAQDLAIDRHSRREHGFVLCGRKSDLDKNIRSEFDVTAQQHVQTSKPDVLKHRVDLESLATHILSADFHRKAVIDSRTAPPLNPPGRGSIIGSRTIGLRFQRSQNCAFLC